MVKSPFHRNIKVVLDRCPKCQGVWFDAGELNLLRQLYHTLTTSNHPAVVGLRDRAAERRQLQAAVAEADAWAKDRRAALFAHLPARDYYAYELARDTRNYDPDLLVGILDAAPDLVDFFFNH